MLFRMATLVCGTLSILLLTGCDAGTSASRTPRSRCELRLELPTTFRQKADVHAKVAIKNIGKDPVTLVVRGTEVIVACVLR